MSDEKRPSLPSAYESCGACRGYGIVESWGPSVQDCRECEGSGQVRKRDSKGRYTPASKGSS